VRHGVHAVQSRMARRRISEQKFPKPWGFGLAFTGWTHYIRVLPGAIEGGPTRLLKASALSRPSAVAPNPSQRRLPGRLLTVPSRRGQTVRAFPRGAWSAARADDSRIPRPEPCGIQNVPAGWSTGVPFLGVPVPFAGSCKDRHVK
jgi:hypothetical protein